MLNIQNKKQGFILAILILLVDQISKRIALNFYYKTNSGAAFGILEGQRFLLIIISLVALFYANRYFEYNPLAFSLFIGGLFGNLYDRVFRGEVIDFIKIGIPSFSSTINLADITISISMILLTIQIIKDKNLP
jgi:signal peptidase II